MSDRLARAEIAVVENTSSRVDGIRLRLGGTAACDEGSDGLKMKKEPTARNSICRYAREDTSWEMRAEVVCIIWGLRASEYDLGEERPAPSDGRDMLAELKMEGLAAEDDVCSARQASASCRLKAASGPP